MAQAFTLGEGIEASVISSAGLAGNWSRVIHPVYSTAKTETDNLKNTDSEIRIIENINDMDYPQGHTLIYCTSGDSSGELKYLDKDNNALEVRAVFLELAKLNIVKSRQHLIASRANVLDRDSMIYNLILGAQKLASAKSKTELEVKEDVAAQIDAYKDFAATKTALESSWSTTFTGTNLSHLRNVYNVSVFLKWVLDMNTHSATLLSDLDNLEDDADNSETDVLNFVPDYSSITYPTTFSPASDL